MSHEEAESPAFYGIDIIRRREQEHIQKLLSKYRLEEANDALKAKIWDDLQMEKYFGRITIPFKVTLRRDAYHKFPDYVEVILDTKV